MKESLVGGENRRGVGASEKSWLVNRRTRSSSAAPRPKRTSITRNGDLSGTRTKRSRSCDNGQLTWTRLLQWLCAVNLLRTCTVQRTP